eukprot:403337377
MGKCMSKKAGNELFSGSPTPIIPPVMRPNQKDQNQSVSNDQSRPGTAPQGQGLRNQTQERSLGKKDVDFDIIGAGITITQQNNPNNQILNILPTYSQNHNNPNQLQVITNNNMKDLLTPLSIVSLNTQEHKENAIELFKKNHGENQNSYGPGGVPLLKNNEQNIQLINHEYGDEIQLEFKSENSSDIDNEMQNLGSGDQKEALYKTSGLGTKPRYPLNSNSININNQIKLQGEALLAAQQVSNPNQRKLTQLQKNAGQYTKDSQQFMQKNSTTNQAFFTSNILSNNMSPTPPMYNSQFNQQYGNQTQHKTFGSQIINITQTQNQQTILNNQNPFQMQQQESLYVANSAIFQNSEVLRNTFSLQLGKLANGQQNQQQVLGSVGNGEYQSNNQINTIYQTSQIDQRNQQQNQSQLMIQNSIERQMLIKYVITWNELAISYQQNGMFVESLECYQTAIIIYEKLLMYGHIQYALGDYILSKLMIHIDQIVSQQNSEILISLPGAQTFGQINFNIKDSKQNQSNKRFNNYRDDDIANEDDCNEELYREILASSQNRYSQPDYNQKNDNLGSQLDTSQNQQYHQHYGLRNCLEFLQRTDSQELNIFQYIVALIFLTLKKKPKKIRMNLKLTTEIIEKSTRLNKVQKLYFQQILQMFLVLAQNIEQLLQQDNAQSSRGNNMGETGGSQIQRVFIPNIQYRSTDQSYQHFYNQIIKYFQNKSLDPDFKVRVFDLLQRQVRDKQTEFLEHIVINENKQYNSLKSQNDIIQTQQYYLESQSLLELLKSQLQLISPTTKLYDTLLKLAHIIRVWLLLPQQALFFYNQALDCACNSSFMNQSTSQSLQAQTYFFIGITLRSLHQPDEAIRAYQKALEINPLYSDCYFNLGNIYFEEKNDMIKAEICHKSALESLEENKKIEMYRRLEEEQLSPGNINQNINSMNQQQNDNQQPKSIITIGRVCNMIGEINKKKNDYEAAIKFYLRGISQEPSYLDNYVDLADISELLNEIEISRLFFIFAKIIAQINEGGLQQRILQSGLGTSGLNSQTQIEELILDRKDWQMLQENVQSLRMRISQKRIGSHFLRAVNVLQRLIEKYIHEVDKINQQILKDRNQNLSQKRSNSQQEGLNMGQIDDAALLMMDDEINQIAHKVLTKFFNLIKVL